MSAGENAFTKVQWNGDDWQPSDDDDADGLPVRAHGLGLAEADLQLLELAARAIGAVRVEVVAGETWVNLYFADGSTVCGWNPLQFSGDALELAVKLELDVMPSGAVVGTNGALAALVQSGYGIDEVEEHAGDPLAATCRAITRAAGEIGKQHSN